MPFRRRIRNDEGAIAVLVAILLTGVLMPMFVLTTSSWVRSTTFGELQRSTDAGALAGAASIPFGNPDFVVSYLDTTSNGATSQPLQQLGLDYPLTDPLDVACNLARSDATAHANLGATYATTPTCTSAYLPDLGTFSALHDCASALTATPVGSLGSALPDLSPLLPALLHPGVQVSLTWHEKGPLDQFFNDGGHDQKATSIARRRFKDIVVVPESGPLAIGPTGGGTIDLTSAVDGARGLVVGNLRDWVSAAIDGSEQLLRSNPVTSVCAGVLDDARGDILDAVDPPAGGPTPEQILSDAYAARRPLLVAPVVAAAEGLSVPFLDFVPVCVDRLQGSFVGHIQSFAGCTVASPGAFRASLRRS